jgi:hypothetical protein
MAYQGRKVFVAGQVLTASDMNSTVDQTVMVFANSGARSAAIPSPTEGMVTYLLDTNAIQFWTGSAWLGVGDDGINIYADEAARDSDIPSPTAGLVVYIIDIAQLQYYDGAAWTQVGTGAGGGGFETNFLLMGA